MKRFMYCYVAALTLSAVATLEAAADITVRLPKGSDIKELEVAHYPISKVITAQSRSDLWVEDGVVPVVNGEAVIPIATNDNCRYFFGVKGSFSDNVFTSPGDNILVEIASLYPYYSVASGSEFMDGVTALKQESVGIMKAVDEIYASGQEPSKEKIDSIRNEQRIIFTDFIEENPTSPLVAYAIFNLEDKDFQNYFTRMSEGAKNSIIYPLLQARNMQLEQQKEEDRKREALESGNIPAPQFSLENTYGKKVSLSDFKGKWVILDFWGSWCIWCIKGFPELKEAYQKYAGTLEVIGIDCRESKEAWLAGIKKYELPWVNLYCPDGNPLLHEYGVQGFPTKAIIDPEGKIRNITVGHDPEFFTKLDALMAQ